MSKRPGFPLDGLCIQMFFVIFVPLLPLDEQV